MMSNKEKIILHLNNMLKKMIISGLEILQMILICHTGLLNTQLQKKNNKLIKPLFLSLEIQVHHENDQSLKIDELFIISVNLKYFFYFKLKID